jgi:hypothetical protein
VDETGHSGDSGPASSGAGSESRDRTPVNGWATPDGPWSNAGAALDPEEEDLPAWRRPSAEIRPFARRPPSAEPLSAERRPFERPSGDVRPSSTFRGLMAVPDPFGPQTGSGFEASGELRPLSDIDREDSGDHRFSDLLPSRPPEAGPAVGEPEEPEMLRPDSLESARSDLLLPGALLPATERPDTLRSADERRAREARVSTPPPSSAPPYPYEGDLEDARRESPRSPAAPHRGSVPLSRMFPAVRPATPGGRRVDWIGAESARHAVDQRSPRRVRPGHLSAQAAVRTDVAGGRRTKLSGAARVPGSSAGRVGVRRAAAARTG